jgi:hypothetical protein
MNYRPFLAEGDAYFRIISNSMERPKKLGNKVLFSISTMMIEKYLVSLLLANRKVVTGHTIRSLVSMASRSFESLPVQIKELARVDDKLDLCSFSPVDSREPSDEEMKVLYANLIVLKEFVHESVAAVNAVSEQ